MAMAMAYTFLVMDFLSFCAILVCCVFQNLESVRKPKENQGFSHLENQFLHEFQGIYGFCEKFLKKLENLQKFYNFFKNN